ncbi:hypothetical protein ACFQ14_05955 [Pseudahrensia aquimaris]|uniref:CoxF protein n=1 Tax=Pseudahrensia aquimaris TaxID=744461 RepID=A0ABW3FF93_9HYPH
MTETKKPAPLEMVTLSEKQVAARRKRSIAIAACLGFMVVAFYGATVVKLGPEVANKPMNTVNE